MTQNYPNKQCPFWQTSKWCVHKRNLDYRQRSCASHKNKLLKPKRCMEKFCPLLKVKLKFEGSKKLFVEANK
jgi:hypothetical protein